MGSHFERSDLLGTTQYQELKLDIAELKLLMVSIDASLANKKKTITKKAADVTDGAIAEVTTGVASLAVNATPKTKVNIPKERLSVFCMSLSKFVNKMKNRMF